MMATFKPNRSLLNPKFENYKLSPLEQEQVVAHYELPYKPSQMNVSGRAHVSFQEVQSRISHNHLAISNERNGAVYVDRDLRVIQVTIDQETLIPSFMLLASLPRPIISPEADLPQREYPSAAFLNPLSLFVSDGYGALYVLRIPEGNGHSAEVLGTFELNIPPAYQSVRTSVPFRMHQVVQLSVDAVVVILSSKHYSNQSHDQSTGANGSARTRHSAPTFNIWAVRVTLPFPPSNEGPLPLDIVWHRRGSDVPIYTTYDAGRTAFLLVGGSAYRSLDVAPAPSYTPSADEIAPIPRAGENVDGNPQNGTDPSQTDNARPPPYSWTQSSDSVTIAIPLPSTTRKEDIKVSPSPRTLTVFVNGPSSSSNAYPLPRVDMKPLWDNIQPSTSLWTWDRAAERDGAFGVLTLHLDKTHEGTRWSSVFASPSSSNPSYSTTSPEWDVEVPETLDPSELYAIREALEKYTAALQTGEDASGLGLGRGVPSLAKDEVDEEVDVSIGRSVHLTWVGANGDASLPQDDTPVNLLSTPLPDGFTIVPSLVLKNGIDGVLYGLTSSSEGVPAWRHISTFPALAFVLASKRDTRFTYHVGPAAVFAFESGARELGGNVYIFRGTSTSKDLYAKQAILRTGGGSAGSLLGVGMVRLGEGDGKAVILCLCEDELLVLRDVL